MKLPVTYLGGNTLYRVGGKPNGGFWSAEPPPSTEIQWRVDYAIKHEFLNDGSTLYKINIPNGSSISGFEGTVGSQGLGLYGDGHQIYIDTKSVPQSWRTSQPTPWNQNKK